MSKRRFLYIGLSILIFLLGILILTKFKHSQFIRGFMGDVFVVMLMYFSLKTIFINLSKLKSAIIVFLIALFIEILQYFKFADLIEAKGILRTAIGTNFDPFDIAAYFVGAVFAYFLDSYIQSKLK